MFLNNHTQFQNFILNIIFNFFILIIKSSVTKFSVVGDTLKYGKIILLNIEFGCLYQVFLNKYLLHYIKCIF